MRGDLAWAGFAQYRGFVYEGTNDAFNFSVSNGEPDDISSESWIAPRPILQYIHNPNSQKAREEGWAWKTGELAGNAPWQNSYEEFGLDVRLIGQNYSIVPEFRMSNHMSFYVNDRSGNFRAENKDILEVVGATGDLTSSADYFSTPVEFFSYDGIVEIEEYRYEPNFAIGYENVSTGVMHNTSRLPIDEICIQEPPGDIDSIKRNWTCAEEYPVAKLNVFGDDILQNQFKDRYRSTPLGGSAEESPFYGIIDDQWMTADLSQQDEGTSVSFKTKYAAKAWAKMSHNSGIPLGFAYPPDQNSTDPTPEDIIWDQWENSFMVSFWVNLDKNSTEAFKENGESIGA